MFFNNLLKSGWLHAMFIASVAYPLGAVTAKLMASNIDCNMLVYTVVFYISSAFALLLKSGPGPLGIATLKRPETWLYALGQILVLVFGILIMKYVSATEGAGLYRLTGLFVLIFSYTFLAQNLNKYEFFASILIFLGFWSIIDNSDIPTEAKVLLALFVIGRAISQASQKIITETHKTSRKAKNGKDESRVAGFVMVVAGFAMLVMLLIIAYFKQKVDVAFFNPFPSYHDFANWNGYLMAVFMGFCIVSVSKYCEFYASKTIGSKYLATLLSLQIIFVYFIENLLAELGYMDKVLLDINELKALGLILFGNLVIALSGFIKDFKFIKLGEKQDTLANLEDNFVDNEKDFNLVKLNLANLLTLYDNDSKELSKDIEIDRIKLDNIANYEYGELKLETKLAKIINDFASQHVSTKDKLTKAYNRYYLDHKAGNLFKTEDGFKLYYLDLNNFKPINDEHGHDVGDYVLLKTVSRLNSLDAFKDHVFRVGGDEFVLIQTEGLDNDLSKQIINAIEQPIGFKDSILEISTSIGIALSANYDNLSEMLKDADSLMYKDKFMK